MVTTGLYVRLEAKPGREEDVEDFLRGALPAVRSEAGTTAWFAIRMGPSTFGIFDVFADEAGREAHLSGQVAAALKAKAAELFARPPAIEKLDVLAAKLAESGTVRSEGREERIPMMVGSELRMRNSGEMVIGNPEVDLARNTEAAAATLAWRFDQKTGEHTLRLVDPVADHAHMATHHRDD